MPFAPTGSASGGGLTSLFTSTLGAPAASIDTGAAGIAAGHGTLIVYFMGQDTTAGAAQNVKVTVNNDSGANYDIALFSGNGATASASSGTASNNWNPIIHGNAGTTGYPGIVIITIPAYDQTTFNKVGTCEFASTDATGTNQWTGRYAVGWRNTAAISRMAFTGAGNLATGSTLTIYGTK